MTNAEMYKKIQARNKQLVDYCKKNKLDSQIQTIQSINLVSNQAHVTIKLTDDELYLVNLDNLVASIVYGNICLTNISMLKNYDFSRVQNLF